MGHTPIDNQSLRRNQMGWGMGQRVLIESFLLFTFLFVSKLFLIPYLCSPKITFRLPAIGRYPALRPEFLEGRINLLTNKTFMATDNLQAYELMVIFTPVLAEDDYKGAQKKFADFITENGGKITNQNAWGLRSLAYPIEKKTTGLYWVVEYQAATDVNAKMEIQMNRDENVMRHMITRLDKYAVIYNNRKRNKLSEVETAAS